MAEIHEPVEVYANPLKTPTIKLLVNMPIDILEKTKCDKAKKIAEIKTDAVLFVKVCNLFTMIPRKKNSSNIAPMMSQKEKMESVKIEAFLTDIIFRDKYLEIKFSRMMGTNIEKA